VATEFHLPDVGEGLAEAVIVGWYVEVGGVVGMDAPLVEVETDKAVVDIPSPVAGVLLHRGAEAGDTLEVDALLAVVGDAGEAWTPGAVGTPGSAGTRDAASSDTAVGREERPEALPIVGTLDEAADTPGRLQALPMVRRLADELGVALATVAPSGPGGRITEADVRAAADTGHPVRRTPMSPMRRAIAERMQRSWQEIPHVTTYGEADASALLAKRLELGKPPLEALLIALLAPLLKEYPAFNASVDGTTIVERLHYDVGFAIDTAEGLMVGVVHDADARSISDLAAEVERIAAAARERSARPEELRGQTFTVSNIGAAGGRYGTPLVPYGTSAILSVGRAEPRPVARDDEIVIATEFPLSLAYDHRIIDGATGRRFLSAVIAAIEAAAL
jgi:pyruvate dehydrogenase E2 component (dihydrolipoamide acetyltransferase)